MDDLAVLVPEDLKFNMMRVNDQFLDVNIGVSERLFGLHACAVEPLHKASFIVCHAHPATATASNRFDHHGVSDLACDLDRFLLVGNDAIAAGRDGNARFFRAFACTVLVPHEADGFGGRADEGNVCRCADFGKRSIFSQKSVTGMDGIDVCDLGRTDDPINFQITFASGCGADANRLVGELHMQ